MMVPGERPWRSASSVAAVPDWCAARIFSFPAGLRRGLGRRAAPLLAQQVGQGEVDAEVLEFPDLQGLAPRIKES